MTPLTRKPVERQDVRALIALDVRPDQPGLVAPNAVTLAQAPYETGAHVFSLWLAGEPVGFFAMIDCREHRYLEPGDNPEDAYLWRLMIAGPHQGKGLGRAAIDEVLDVARGWGSPRLLTSVVGDKPGSALDFYRRLGFTETGRIPYGEIELARAV